MHQYLATGDYYTTVLYRSFHELVPGCPLFLLEKRDETRPGLVLRAMCRNKKKKQRKDAIILRALR